MEASPDISSAPGLLLGLAALVGLILLFVGWRAARWARRGAEMRSLAAVLALSTLGAFLLIAAGSGFRHYGGHDDMTGAYKCDAWWAQMGSPHGVTDGLSGPWPWCKQQAEKAIAPGLAESGVGGLVIGIVASMVVYLRRRRLDHQLLGLTDASSPTG